MCLDEVMKLRTKSFVFRLAFPSSGSSYVEVFVGIEGWKPEVFGIGFLPGIFKALYFVLKLCLLLQIRDKQGSNPGKPVKSSTPINTVYKLIAGRWWP